MPGRKSGDGTVVEQHEQDVVGRTELPKPAALQQDTRPAPTPGTIIFDVRGVSIWYGTFKAVTDVSLPHLRA
jgi:hypothetical protein